MSPEQARGEAVDARSDLFSMGGLIYAMLTGRPPFRAPTTLAVLRRIEEENTRPLQEIQPQTPFWVQHLVAQLHAKERDARIQSADELVQLLKACLSHLSAPQHHQLPSALIRKNDRGRRWLAGATLLASCSVLIFALIVNRPFISGEPGTPSESNLNRDPATQQRFAPTSGVDGSSSDPATFEPSPTDPLLPIDAVMPADATTWDDGLDPVLQRIQSRIDGLAP